MSASHARAISDAIVARVQTAATADTATIYVGDGVAPATTGTPPLYAIVDHMDGTVRGDLDNTDTTVKHVIQVRSVGATRNAAQYVQDVVRAGLLARDLTVSGIALLGVDLEVGGRVYRDDDADPTSLFVAIDRFAFTFDTRSS